MIVTPHLGGTRLRLRFSNLYGPTESRLDRVTVGIRSAGGAIRRGTLREVRFGGRSGTTLPASGGATSDAMSLRFAAFDQLAVSVAIHGTIVRPTEHFTTREVNYIGTGDRALQTGGSGFNPAGGALSVGWYFLSGIDVAAPARYASVAAFGDSITDGFQGRVTPVTEDLGSVGLNQRYPDYLARRLLASGRPLSVFNAGISGNRVLQEGQIPMFGHSGLRRVAVDAGGQPGVTDAIVLEGINDIGQGPVPADDLIAGYENLIAQLHAKRVRVLLGTLTPSGGTLIPTYGASGAESIRAPVNAWIRSQRLSDGVIDFDRAVRDAAHPARLRPAYDGSDHLHFSPAGYAALAQAVDLRKLLGNACAAGRVTLRVKLSRAERSRLRHRGARLGGVVRLNRPGRVRLSAAIERTRHGRVVGRRRLARGSLRFAHGGRKRVRLRLTKSGRAAVRSTRRGRRRIILTARFHDASGTYTKRAKARLRR